MSNAHAVHIGVAHKLNAALRGCTLGRLGVILYERERECEGGLGCVSMCI